MIRLGNILYQCSLYFQMFLGISIVKERNTTKPNNDNNNNNFGYFSPWLKHPYKMRYVSQWGITIPFSHTYSAHITSNPPLHIRVFATMVMRWFKRDVFAEPAVAYIAAIRAAYTKWDPFQLSKIILIWLRVMCYACMGHSVKRWISSCSRHLLLHRYCYTYCTMCLFIVYHYFDDSVQAH